MGYKREPWLSKAGPSNVENVGTPSHRAPLPHFFLRPTFESMYKFIYPISSLA